MVATPSSMVPLGSPAPDFALAATDGSLVSRQDFTGTPLLVMFICNHCPYVRHIRGRLAAVTTDFVNKGVAVVGIQSNDGEAYPDDAPPAMAREATEQGYAFPYLYDERQDVARAYGAACTPDFFLFDAHHRLVYRGQFDASRPGNDVPVTGTDLRAAVDAVLAGSPPLTTQHPSLGCNIKWKPGSEPV